VALSGANLETAAFEAGEVSARQTNTVTWPMAAMALIRCVKPDQIDQLGNTEASNLNGTTFIFQCLASTTISSYRFLPFPIFSSLVSI
jgi:hypothetical protein